MATINRKRLWVFCTVAWCTTIALLFGFRVRDEFRSYLPSYEGALHDEMHRGWSSCIAKIGSTEAREFSLQAEVCSQQNDKKLCAGSMFPTECANSLSDLCMSGFEAREPRCRYAYDEYQRRWGQNMSARVPVEPIWYFARSSKSRGFWQEIGLLFLGPLVFWLAPKTFQRVRAWLYG